VGVYHPGVHDGGERKETETEDEDQQAVIGTLQISGREEHEQEHKPGEDEDQKHEQAGHEVSPLELSQRSFGGGSAVEYVRV
jgi:hypothetical protein